MKVKTPKNSPIAAYGNARWRGVKFEQDAADHLSEINEGTE